MTHSTKGPVIKFSANTPTEAVDDFLLVPQDDPNRPAYYVAGDMYTALTTTKEADFDFNAFDFFFPVNGGPPPHVHFFEQETFYINDGEIRFSIGDQANYNLVLPQGSFFFGPEDRAHTPNNIGSTAAISGGTPGARIFATTTPGALDLFFDAVGTNVVDRSRPIPGFFESTPTGFLDREAQARFALRIPGAPSNIGEGVDPNYKPPEDALDYIIVLPEDAEGEVVEAAKALDAELDELSVWTTGDLAGVPKRPTYTGPFGIEYNSLTSLEESGGEFSFNQFSLELTDAGNFPDPVESDDHEIFYVNEGHLSVKVGDEVRVVREDTYFYIAPGNEYSIANFGDETVEALAATVVDLEPEFLQEDVPSPLNSQGGVSPDAIVFLSDEADFFDNRSVEEQEGHRRIYGGEANDEILVNVEDRAFGEDGDDLLDASLGSGRNLLDSGYGNDILIAGSNDQLVGGDGDDILNIRRGGDNLLYGGSGPDQFRIVNGRLPDAVEVQYPAGDIRLPAGVSIPELVDTRNTIMDFEPGVDKIYILGVENVSSFDDLQLLPAFENLGSTSIVATFTEDGIEKEISLANVSGVIFNELSANNFVFA